MILAVPTVTEYKWIRLYIKAAGQPETTFSLHSKGTVEVTPFRHQVCVQRSGLLNRLDGVMAPRPCPLELGHNVEQLAGQQTEVWSKPMGFIVLMALFRQIRHDLCTGCMDQVIDAPSRSAVTTGLFSPTKALASL